MVFLHIYSGSRHNILIQYSGLENIRHKSPTRNNNLISAKYNKMLLFTLLKFTKAVCFRLIYSRELVVCWKWCRLHFYGFFMNSRCILIYLLLFIYKLEKQLNIHLRDLLALLFSFHLVYDGNI